MKGKKIVAGLFFAALAALLAWAILTNVFGQVLTNPERFFGIESSVDATLTDDEDVLFDDDSTVDWSDPATDVFEPSYSSGVDSSHVSEDAGAKVFEFVLTPDYFNALLEKHSDGLPLEDVTSSFSEGTVILSGKAKVSELASLLNIPAALVIFLPETVPCTLHCVPEVSHGQMYVKVTKVSAGSDVLAPYLSRSEILSSVEWFLNDRMTKYLPSEYIMQSARVTETGMYVQFLAQ